MTRLVRFVVAAASFALFGGLSTAALADPRPPTGYASARYDVEAGPSGYGVAVEARPAFHVDWGPRPRVFIRPRIGAAWPAWRWAPRVSPPRYVYGRPVPYPYYYGPARPGWGYRTYPYSRRW